MRSGLSVKEIKTRKAEKLFISNKSSRVVVTHVSGHNRAHGSGFSFKLYSNRRD